MKQELTKKYIKNFKVEFIKKFIDSLKKNRKNIY